MPSTVRILPSHDELRVLAASLARNLARQPADIDDLMQEGLWSAYRCLARTKDPKKPFALARTVMQRAMITYYAGGWRRSGARYREHIPLPAGADGSHNPVDGWNGALDLRQYLHELEQEFGITARQMAENLITPRHPVYCQLLHDKARRTNRTIRPSNKQLRQSLKLTRKQWKNTLRVVRVFTRTWLATYL